MGTHFALSCPQASGPSYVERSNNIAAKRNSKESWGRKWFEVELKVFASVLADD